MSTNDSKSFIPQDSGSLSRIKPRSLNPIMQRMTRDILALLEEQNRLEQARFTLGDYEFREPDYQQILRWAKAWGCSAEDVLERLIKSIFEDSDSEPVCQIMFTVVDGRIHSLAWDCDQFPAEGWTWHEGLDIQTLAFRSADSLSRLPFTLPASLQTLYCQALGLDTLDLSTVPNLTELRCNNNQLTKLDLSSVPNLTGLSCSSNQLTELDLSPVPNLKGLGCSDNQITELDLSSVPNLTGLVCGYNQLTELDLASVPNLMTLFCYNNPLTDLDIRLLTNLKTFMVDHTTRLIGTAQSSCRVVYWRYGDLDLQSLFRYTLGDYEFREPDYQQILRWAEAWGCSAEDVLERLTFAVFERPGDHITFTVVDGRIHSLVWDCDQFPAEGWTWHEGLDIETLVFISAEPLSRLPFTLPASLLVLYCPEIGLDTLDLSPVPNLIALVCNNNQLTELDLSPLPNLMVFICSDNQLTKLDLSPVPNLISLGCDHNPLTDLDSRPLTNLKSLYINRSTRLIGTPPPSCEISYFGYGDLDLQSPFRYTLGDYEFREPDYQQILRWAEAWGCSAEEVLERLVETALEDFDSEFYLEPERPIEFTVLDGRIHSLVWDCDQFPAEGWTWHEGLDIQILAFICANSLGRLPITFPASLHTLYCPEIGLEKLDLSPVPHLTVLECRDNQLTALDLSLVPNLTVLECGGNQLTELDLSPVPNLTKLACYSNPLTTLNLPPTPNLTVLSCSRNQLTELDLSPVPNLNGLACAYNQLTTLDLSHIPNLTLLRCHSNPLTTLNLPPTPNLTVLGCGYNKLTELDLSLVPNLTELWCVGNRLTKLDLSSVPNLTELWCGGNQLTELDLSPVPNLTVLGCGYNELTTLDLSPVPNLKALWCYGNQLTELDLSHIPNLKKLHCENNPLTNLDIRPITNLKEFHIDRTTRLIGTPPPGCKVVYL